MGRLWPDRVAVVTGPVDPTLRPAPELAHVMVAQWRCVTDGVRHIDDWDTPTRLAGWTARTLLGHLVVVAEAIPRTLAEPPTDAEPTSVYAVFRGAAGRAPDNDRRAREFAAEADPSALVARLEAAVAAASTMVDDIDGDAILPTRFGPLPTRHFLVHRIVEGVVHGLDLPAARTPDPRALEVCASALTHLLVQTRPELAGQIPADELDWVEAATGRAPAPAELREVLPLLA
jgi:uncharacterized protein (TIGR03083 family)